MEKLNKNNKKHQKLLTLNMPFDEAMRRLIRVKPEEIKEAMKKDKGKS